MKGKICGVLLHALPYCTNMFYILNMKQAGHSVSFWLLKLSIQFLLQHSARILSCPGKSTLPVIISARIQAADQTSTVSREGDTERILIMKM